MTLRDLLRPGGIFQPTETQYAILQRADVLLRNFGGRFFGGQLWPSQVAELTKGLEVRPGTPDGSSPVVECWLPPPEHECDGTNIAVASDGRLYCAHCGWNDPALEN